ncbi:MAG: 23S rRNA (uracil(1939)-C(5))-methyltransferase RlmD [Angelakisella sp.]
MLNKNDIITLNIDSITNEGNGVGRYEGMAVFVPMTAPAEQVQVRIVKVQKSYCYGIVEELLSPSPDRIVPDCPVFKRCGGCSLRHIRYSGELAAKEQWVADAVRRLGGIELPVLPILPSPQQDGYRNKAQYPIGKDSTGKVFCGFYAPRTHSIVPAASCRLQPEFFEALCGAVCAYIEATGGSVYDEATGTGLFRHLYLRYGEASGEVMVCLVINGKSIPKPKLLTDSVLAACDKVKSIILNHNTQNTNVILGKESTLLWGSDHISDILCGVELDISPLSFYQVNRQGAEQLYGVAARMADLSEGQLLLDLYCGAGTIGLSMARQSPKVQLIGVEIIESATKNAKSNALRAGMPEARFITGDAGFAAAKLASEGLRPDVIVVDPPRKGCDTPTLDAIEKMAPKHIVIVSCNPATMARDMARLVERGYTVQEIQPVDMFPRTNHVEAVALLSRE